MDYGVADGRRGPQALSVRVLDPVPSVARGQRKPADDMAVIVEDLIKLLDKTVQEEGLYVKGQRLASDAAPGAESAATPKRTPAAAG